MLETKERPFTEVEHLFRNLDKPSLHALSYALRHPDVWPDGFVWNFADCERCAIGLACRLWNMWPCEDEGVDWNRANQSLAAKKFAMPYAAAGAIFMGRR